MFKDAKLIDAEGTLDIELVEGSIEVLVKICTALGCNVHDIMDITDMKTKRK